MAAIVPVATTNTLDQFRQITNEVINTVNNLQADSDNVFTLADPVNDQDIMTWDTATQKFTNTTVSVLVTEILAQNAANSQNNVKDFYLANLGTVYTF